MCRPDREPDLFFLKPYQLQGGIFRMTELEYFEPLLMNNENTKSQFKNRISLVMPDQAMISSLKLNYLERNIARLIPMYESYKILIGY